MDWGNAVEEFGGDALGALGDIVTGYGSSWTNSANADAAAIERTRANTAIEIAKAKSQEEQNKRMFNLAVKFFYLMAVIAVLYVIFKMAAPLMKGK